MAVPLNHDINEKVKDLFDEMCAELPGSKKELIEAMIKAFYAMRRDLRVKVLSPNDEDQRLSLDLIGALQIPIKPGTTSHKKKFL